ncbi:MAG: hypothetical protein FJ291_16015 [Planctomycetes bacterium]|nr:hypothetical protein [Planctomycetota bacterium]
MITLPNADHARIDSRKITEYLLCSTHPEGASKARFFKGFGFRIEDWQVLAGAIRAHGAAHLVVRVVESAYGTRYTVEGPLETPSGRKPIVRTVWVVDEGPDAPRLITAYPA